MPQDVDFGPPSQSEIRRMKSQARASDAGYQEAYETGKDEAKQAASVPLPRGGKLSFSNDAQKIIVITMTVTGLVALVENIHNGHISNDISIQKLGGVEIRTDEPGTALPTVPIVHIIVGTFAAGAILLAMSYLLPEFAAGLSVVAMMATVLDRGKPFWEVVTAASGKTPTITGGSTPELTASVPLTLGTAQAAPVLTSASNAPNPYNRMGAIPN